MHERALRTGLFCFAALSKPRRPRTRHRVSTVPIFLTRPEVMTVAAEEHMAGLVQDKVALVTGAASGIGRATAQIFAREGARVAVADLNLDGCEETAAMIKKAGGDAFAIRCNVARSAEVQAMVEQVVRAYGRLDLGFNNAGVSPAGG